MLKQIPQHHPWSSGSYVDVATLNITSAQIEATLCCELLLGVEAGLGEWSATGVQTPKGVIIELVQYAEAPVKGVFTVRIDADADHKAALDELLSGLKLSRSHVAWLSTSAGG